MIRKYVTSDTDELIRVWREASEIATPFLPPEFLEDEAVRVRTVYLPNAETWVFEDGGAIVGFIALLGDEVGGLFVEPAAQGRGFGRLLMDHAVALRGSLQLDVFKENATGRRFYDRYGFGYHSEYPHPPTGLTLIRMVYPPGRTPDPHDP